MYRVTEDEGRYVERISDRGRSVRGKVYTAEWTRGGATDRHRKRELLVHDQGLQLSQRSSPWPSCVARFADAGLNILIYIHYTSLHFLKGPLHFLRSRSASFSSSSSFDDSRIAKTLALIFSSSQVCVKHIAITLYLYKVPCVAIATGARTTSAHQ